MQQAFNNGVSDAFEFPGFVPAYIRPLFCEGKGPFRWVALSGDKEDIYATDQAIMELFPEDTHLHRWLKLAREKVPFQGMPRRSSNNMFCTSSSFSICHLWSHDTVYHIVCQG